MATWPRALVLARDRAPRLVLAATRLAWVMADCPQLAAARLATPRLDANGNHLQLKGWAGPRDGMYLYRRVCKNFLLFPKKPIT